MSSLTIQLDNDLHKRLDQEAQRLRLSPAGRVIQILQGAVAPAHTLDQAIFVKGIQQLEQVVRRLPAISHVSTSSASEPYWWIKFQLNIEYPFAWNVIQELAFIFNSLSVDEQLPTMFKPVSPPPYLNGGPKQYLSWVIEAAIPFLDAGYVAEVLDERLPTQGDEERQWQEETDDR